MRVFISWSGNKSKQIAEEFKKWLPNVIQAVKPYFSPDDIVKGTRWITEISKALEECSVGIICVTEENIEAPWLMFEAGALSKNLETSKVVPILFGINDADLKGPLVQFQSAKFNQAEIKRIMLMINEQLGERALSTDTFEDVYKMWWPILEGKIESILKDINESVPPPKKKSERDLLEEILITVRSQAKRSRPEHISPDSINDLIKSYYSLMSSVIDMGITPDLASQLKDFIKPLSYLISRIYNREIHNNSDNPYIKLLSEAIYEIDSALPTVEH